MYKLYQNEQKSTRESFYEKEDDDDDEKEEDFKCPPRQVPSLNKHEHHKHKDEKQRPRESSKCHSGHGHIEQKDEEAVAMEEGVPFEEKEITGANPQNLVADEGIGIEYPDTCTVLFSVHAYREGFLGFHTRSPIDYDLLNSQRPGLGSKLKQLLNSKVMLDDKSAKALEAKFSHHELMCALRALGCLISPGIGPLCQCLIEALCCEGNNFDDTDQKRVLELLISMLLDTGLRPSDFDIIKADMSGDPGFSLHDMLFGIVHIKVQSRSMGQIRVHDGGSRYVPANQKDHDRPTKMHNYVDHENEGMDTNTHTRC